MRLVDTVLAFPLILVALLIIVVMGPGIHSIILAIALTTWARFARQVRGGAGHQGTGLRNPRSHCRSAGASDTQASHLSQRCQYPPDSGKPSGGGVILTEASLSFLGLGLPRMNPPGGLWCRKAVTSLSAPGGCPCSPVLPSPWLCWRSTSSGTGCVTPWTPSCGERPRRDYATTALPTRGRKCGPLARSTWSEYQLSTKAALT